MTINYQKNKIAEELSKKTGYPISYSKKIINELITLLEKNISKGSLNLKNFGVFKLLDKKKRLGRNPKTKDEFIISARKSLKFTPSKKFTTYING